MTDILIATPMMPPTAGGPATHAKKLSEYFGERANLFNFEKYGKYPSGIRHLLVFVEFAFRFRKFQLIFALDAFTVALPAILAGKIVGKKIILRVGGDFIYENFLFIKEVTFEDFYNNFSRYKKLMTWPLYMKYLVQKFVLENCQGIIFNTAWQRDIYLKYYNLPKKIFVVENPVEPIPKEIYANEVYENSQKYIFTSITRDIPYKNHKRLAQAFSAAFLENQDIFLETKQGPWSQCLKKISMSRAYVCASISDIAPNQVQEALSLKIPVIISKHTGLSKYLQDTGVARVIDPFNVDDIKSAVLEMCNDEVYVKYKYNLERFTWPQTWNSLFERYEDVINEISESN